MPNHFLAWLTKNIFLRLDFPRLDVSASYEKSKSRVVREMRLFYIRIRIKITISETHRNSIENHIPNSFWEFHFYRWLTCDAEKSNLSRTTRDQIIFTSDTRDLKFIFVIFVRIFAGPSELFGVRESHKINKTVYGRRFMVRNPTMIMRARIVQRSYTDYVVHRIRIHLISKNLISKNYFL